MAVTAVALRTFRGAELHRLLCRDAALRQALGFAAVPHRTTLERRLRSLLPEAEAQVEALGRRLLEEVQPAAAQPRASAIDGRMYESAGPKWHKRDRRKGRVPARLRNVDTESAWFKSGYCGWVRGYRLLLQGLVFPAPVPLFAAWRLNSEGEATITAQALAADSLPVTPVLLDDETFGGVALTRDYAARGGWRLTPKQLSKQRRSWRDDLYAYRKETIELLFQRVIQARGLKSCPVKGLMSNGAFVIVSVWLYQIIFLSNYREGRPAAHVKEQLDLARWRVAT